MLDRGTLQGVKRLGDQRPGFGGVRRRQAIQRFPAAVEHAAEQGRTKRQLFPALQAVAADVFRVDAGAGENTFHLFKRHQEQSLTVKPNHFAFDFTRFRAILTLNHTGCAQRKLQAGGFQYQTGRARQSSITTNGWQLRHLRLKVVERVEPTGEACGHQTTPGAARRHSSCQRVATLASRSPSSAETLQPPWCNDGSPRKRQPCRLRVAPRLSSTRCRSSG